MEILDLKQILNKNNLHHAYCFEGNKDILIPIIISFFEKEIGIKTKNNPDFHVYEYDNFSIEESRFIKEQQQKMAFGERKIFIISFSFISREAQNSLLKIFEEPTNNTHFFIIVKKVNILLSTLRSRLMINYCNSVSGSDSKIKVFLNSNIAIRLSFFKEIIENKDKSKAIDFVNELELYLTNNKNISLFSNFLIELVYIKKFLFIQGASVKLILEQIALTCPKI